MRCDPLTILDTASRYLLRCQAVERPNFAYVQPLLEETFREYGLPRVLGSDNGPPFASLAVVGGPGRTRGDLVQTFANRRLRCFRHRQARNARVGLGVRDVNDPVLQIHRLTSYLEKLLVRSQPDLRHDDDDVPKVAGRYHLDPLLFGPQ